MINNILKELIGHIIRILVLVIAVIAVYKAATWAYSSAYSLMAKEPDEDVRIITKEVTIPSGSTAETIANILKDNELINNVWYFRLVAKIEGLDASFQPGDYVFNTGMNDEQIMKILATEGEQRETVTFTIPEGYSIEQIGKRLVEKGLCTTAEFMSAIENGNYGYKFMEFIPDRNLKLQGYLFPDTYEVYADATAEDIVSTMLKRFDQIFKDEYYDRMKELDMDLDSIITIASIIEKEVRVAEERPVVSGVIYNRLDIDMNLQMCSTVMYALDVPRDRLTYNDLEIESPYNTYKYPGLPVGPIASPGEASIIAALYPEDNNYLYFVLTDPIEGRHEFNETLDGHNSSKAKYTGTFNY
ncbi:MAG: endolytic transglycosylase MltG [Vallitaleaceae bacterium]|nr:endolytic transglycosylase MltG [Vallitaleaceae bacterium]